MYLSVPDDGNHAIELFKQSSLLDPAFAMPAAMLGFTAVLNSVYGEVAIPLSQLEIAQQFSDKALELDPEEAIAWLIHGLVKMLKWN